MNDCAMSYMKIILCCMISEIVVPVDAARILAVFPTPSISHQIVFRPVTKELARRGHEVIVITPNPVFPKDKSPANLTEIDVHDISYGTWREELKAVTVGSDNDMETQVKMFLHLFNAIVEKQLLSKEIDDLINNNEIGFDLILVEVCVRQALIYSYIFKAPVIQIGSFGATLGTNAAAGAMDHPLLQPLPVRQRLYNLSLRERICESYRQFKFDYIFYEVEYKENSMVKKILGPDTPTLSELSNNIDMVFLNVYPIWNDNSPVPPGMIYVGSLHQQPVKELPEDLISFMEYSKNGVIYLSFGTNVQSTIVPPHTVKIMMQVFSELPYEVIWKWDTDLPNKPNNVRVYKWLPQSDLLRHPKLKLFIMQGGLQSTDEAIAGGVPMIGIPVIADQWYNVEKHVRLGIGKQLEMGTFTEDEFRQAVVNIIEDQSYRDNILRLRTLVNDQPQSPLERAIWWTEYVLRHGGARHLRSPAANMSWVEYYELKLVSIVLTLLLIIIISIATIMHYIKRYICKKIYRCIKN